MWGAAKRTSGKSLFLLFFLTSSLAAVCFLARRSRGVGVVRGLFGQSTVVATWHPTHMPNTYPGNEAPLPGTSSSLDGLSRENLPYVSVTYVCPPDRETTCTTVGVAKLQGYCKWQSLYLVLRMDLMVTIDTGTSPFRAQPFVRASPLPALLCSGIRVPQFTSILHSREGRAHRSMDELAYSVCMQQPRGQVP